MTTATEREVKHLVVPFEVKAVDEEAGTFEGYAATWDLDLGGDVILPGAFKRTIANWKRSKGKKHRLLDSHDTSTIFSVLGDLLEAEETDKGVLGKWAFLAGDYGDQAKTLVRGGHVDSLSIGYEAVEVKAPSAEDQRKGIFRYIKELKWLETSLVIFPMNPAAAVSLSSVKALLAKGELSDIEHSELVEIHDQLSALLKAAPPLDPPGLAPESPERLAREAKVRGLKLRSLGIVT